jgi:hypothetical protein
MPRFLVNARLLLRGRRGETGTRSSSDRSIESLNTDEYQGAERSLMDSIYGNPASSLPPESTMTKTTNLQSHISTTACPQPGQSLVDLNSRSESVGTKFDLPVQSVSTSTGPARSTIFDHCATNRSSALNSALNLVADILSATYSKCLIYPKGEYKFPNIRPVRELSGNLPAQIERLTKVCSRLCASHSPDIRVRLREERVLPLVSVSRQGWWTCSKRDRKWTSIDQPSRIRPHRAVR